MSSNALSAANVWFRYDGSPQPALRDITLDIPAGQVTAILGPNGCGKTTLLRLFLGVLRPESGALLLAGRPLGSYSRRERSQRLGLVPQDEHVPFDFSVLEFVLLGRAPYLAPLEMPRQGDVQVALDALQAVGLTPLRARAVPSLSSGERQLAVVARALAQGPSILLLDEPTAHLDLSNKGRLLDIIRTLQREGVTVVLTTHDPDLVASLADTTVLMRHGTVCDSGPTEAMLTADKLSATYDVTVKVSVVEGRRIAFLP